MVERAYFARTETEMPERTAEEAAPGRTAGAQPSSRGDIPPAVATAGLVAVLLLAARGSPLLRRALPAPNQAPAGKPAARTSSPGPSKASPSKIRRVLGWVSGALASAEAARNRAAGSGQPASAATGRRKPKAAERSPEAKHAKELHEAETGPDDHARASEPDRGRQATSPTEVPARGWKDVLWRTYEEV